MGAKMAQKTKKWYKSKTVWKALLKFVIGVLTSILTLIEQPTISIASLVVAFDGLADLWLRFITDTKISA